MMRTIFTLSYRNAVLYASVCVESSAKYLILHSLFWDDDDGELFMEKVEKCLLEGEKSKKFIVYASKARKWVRVSKKSCLNMQMSFIVSY
jgi:hypothetical protein